MGSGFWPPDLGLWWVGKDLGAPFPVQGPGHMIEEEIYRGEGTSGLNYPGKKGIFKMEGPLIGMG